MQIKCLIVLSALAGYVAAANCPAQTILDACLKNAQAIVDGCGATDYKCLCQTNKDKLQCYINCPQDSGKGIQESQVSSWCIAAGGGNTSSSSPAAAPSATPSGSSAPAQTYPAATGTGTAGAPSATSSGTHGTSTATTTATTTGSSSTHTGAASAATMNFALAGFAGLAAVLL